VLAINTLEGTPRACWQCAPVDWREPDRPGGVVRRQDDLGGEPHHRHPRLGRGDREGAATVRQGGDGAGEVRLAWCSRPTAADSLLWAAAQRGSSSGTPRLARRTTLPRRAEWVGWPSPRRPALLVAGMPALVGEGSATEPMRLWEVASVSHGSSGPPEGAVKAVAFSPDGRLIATGGNDTTALGWDVRSLAHVGNVVRTPPWDDQLWADLAGDAPTAYRAIVRLMSEPRRAVTLLATRLGPAERKSVARLIVDLDDDDFATREAATATLESLGRGGGGGAKRAAGRNPRWRFSARIGASSTTWRSAGGGSPLAAPAGSEVLEAVGTPELKLIEAVAKGAPKANRPGGRGCPGTAREKVTGNDFAVAPAPRLRSDSCPHLSGRTDREPHDADACRPRPEASRLPAGGASPVASPSPSARAREGVPHPPLEVERLPERDEEMKLDEGEDVE
jgi:hypothetical protein